MRHEVKTFTKPGGPSQCVCRCGWMGRWRQSAEVARVDGKQHRVDTAVDDDVNERKVER